MTGCIGILYADSEFMDLTPSLILVPPVPELVGTRNAWDGAGTRDGWRLSSAKEGSRGGSMVVIVDVPEGSAGFTCNDGLVITRLDEGACVRLVLLCRSRA